MIEINGKTRIVGIIGDPVEHTLSPAMHNSAFTALGLNFAYVPFLVKTNKQGELKKAITAVRALNMAGMNVTVPHKENAAKFLDELRGDAKKIGAINTIVNANGRLIGYNTDGDGYLASLIDETGFSPKGAAVVVVGAGGAARAIVYTLLKSGAKEVTILNRTQRSAKSLAKRYGSIFKGKKISAFGLGASKDILERAGLLVNTTSLGMAGKGELDLPLNLLPKHAIVSDIVYAPPVTGLLRRAKSLGLKTHGGLGMLIFQGALTFELWTGKKAPMDAMRRAIRKVLNK